MRTKINQLAIVAFSFALSDLLSTGPIDHIRWTSLCRGKRRLARVRAFGQRVQGVFDKVGLAFERALAWGRETMQAGCNRVGGKVRSAYHVTREGALSVQRSITGRLTQVWERVSQVGRVIVMFAGMYGLLLTMGRRGKGVLPQERKPVKPTVTVAEPEPAALATSLPMPSAARTTTVPVVDEKAELVRRAKALISEGMSQRTTAKALGVSESSLRSWLKKAK